MKEYLAELISKMTVKEKGGVNSDDSISWHAYREAETLSDPSTVDELAEHVINEKDKNRRSAAYFIIGKLGQKVRSADCVSILLSRLTQEHDKYVLSRLLDALRRISKPRNFDLSPLYRLLHDERWIVRHSAIQALSHTDVPEAEDRLIELLRTTTDPYDMVYCHATLNEIGSAKSIPHLQKNLGSRKKDVKLSAQLAIEAIESRTKLKHA
jgi:HEAT repeat protein